MKYSRRHKKPHTSEGMRQPATVLLTDREEMGDRAATWRYNTEPKT